MNAKKVIFSVLSWSVAALPFVCSAVSITVDKVQQRYPYNGLVDIDYTITYDKDESLNLLNDRVEAIAINRDVSPAVTNRIRTVSPSDSIPSLLPQTPGSHRITWNANADGVKYASAKFVVSISVVRYQPKYLIVDISNPESYTVTYNVGRKASAFNDTPYKGDKIVFRLIPPGRFWMGTPVTEPGRYSKSWNPDREGLHLVTLTKPFYIGLFEVTQAQYEKVVGSNPSEYKGAYRPVDCATYCMIRGETEGVKWPASNAVDPGTFFGILRAKTGLDFDLPTEAQWEYACRAGTSTPYSDGVACHTTDDLATRMNSLGRYSGNIADGKGDYSDWHTTVGSYQPNAWGLYDMHGNVYEWCLDWYDHVITSDCLDPVGPTSAKVNGGRVIRGGTVRDGADGARSGNRNYDTPYRPDWPENYDGFRAALTLSE